VTRGSIRLAGTECATDRWVPLTGQRSMVNADRAATGLGWAWAGPDLGRAGPTTWRTQALPRRTDGFQTALARVGVAHRGLCGVGL
jgi:hypothetical protein